MLKTSAVLAFLVLAPWAQGDEAASGGVTIEGAFQDVYVDADAQGSGLLIGIPAPAMEPAQSLQLDLRGDSVSVETWTRHYRMVAGYGSPDPDRPDERTMQRFNQANIMLLEHGPSADLAVEDRPAGAGFTATLSTSVDEFRPTQGFLYTNDGSLIGTPLHDQVRPQPSEDPRYFHAVSDQMNFEHLSPASHAWVQADGDFVLTLAHGTLEVHNETGTHRVEAHREHLSGTPPVYEEYSITRAFIHVTNGTALIQPGGRPLQVNLAEYDMPSTSTIRLLNASGFLRVGHEQTHFAGAMLRVAGEGMRLTSEPVRSGDDIIQRGRIGGPIHEVYIDGRPATLYPSETVMTEPVGASQTMVFGALALLLAATVVAVLVARRARRRRRAGPLADHAGRLLDDEDYVGAATWAKRALRCDPRHREAAALLAIACLKTGRPDEAVAHLEDAVNEDDPLVQLMLSVSLRQAGHPGQAEHMLRQLLRRHPGLADLVAGTELYASLQDAGVEESATMTGYG